MKLRDTPLPASLHHDESVGKIGGGNSDGATRITDHKWEAALRDINHSPALLIGDGDALTTEDERSVMLIFKDLRRINTPLNGKIRCRIATQRSKAKCFGRGDGREPSEELACARAHIGASREEQPDNDERGADQCDRVHEPCLPLSGSIACTSPLMLVTISRPPMSSAAPTTSLCASRQRTSPSPRIAQVSTSL